MRNPVCYNFFCRKFRFGSYKTLNLSSCAVALWKLSKVMDSASLNLLNISLIRFDGFFMKLLRILLNVDRSKLPESL